MAQIQAALNACPSNLVVALPAGTNTISGTITIPSYVTLRGAGQGQTVLNLTGSASAAIQFGPSGDPNLNAHTTISSGANAGSTNVVVGSASGFTVGQYMMVSELNDDFVTSTGSSGACGWCDCVDGTRVLGQTVEITSINGNTIGFNPPLYITYKSALTPWAYPLGMGCKYGGVESLSLRANNSGYTANVLMNATAYCWLKNVEGDFADGDHVRIYYSYRCEVRDSYFHDGFKHGPGGTDDDLVMAKRTSACLVENNIFWRLHASVMLEWGAAGNVIAYNFSTNNYHENWLAWCINDFVMHGAHPMFNLFEGNIGIMFRPDSTWGSSSHATLLRNMFAGADYYAPPLDARGAIQWANGQWESAGNYAITLDYLTRSNNLVGNIAGSTWLVNNGAVYLRVAPSNNAAACFRFGFNSDTDVPVDTAAYDSSIFTGNYDLVTRSQHWDANGVQTIPNSYYLSGKPSWFGNLPWPPFDPANPAAASVTNIPAGYRFVFQVGPPSGGPDTNAPTISNISVGPTTTNSVKVAWTTDEPATSIVDKGATAAYGISVTNSSLVTLHSLTIVGLSPGSTNHFRVRSIDSSGNVAASSDGTFAIPPTGLRVIGP